MCLFTITWGVDLDEVWNVIEKDLPRLKRTVTAMLDDMNG